MSIFGRMAISSLLLILALLVSYQVSAKPIDKQELIVVNGTTQWLFYRGDDTNNPIVLYVHGGPGNPMMPFSRYFDQPFMQDFVFVHWDQRGAGKSHSYTIPPETYNINQFVQDGLIITKHIRKKFGNRKIILLGHSWGTIVGSKMAQREPQHFKSFIAVGFVVDIEEADKRKFQFITREATERNDSHALEQIRKFGKPPLWTDRENFTKFGSIVAKYDGILRLISFKRDFRTAAERTKEYTELDFQKLDEGEARTFKLLAEEIMAYKAIEQLGKWNLPVYFVQGKYDMATPTSLVEEYITQAQSNERLEYILFEESSHFPVWENGKRFLDLLLSVSREDN